MNDFHLFSRKDSVKQIHIDNYLEWGMLGWVFVCDLMGTEKHNWVDQLCLVALAEGMNGLMVHGLKNQAFRVKLIGDDRHSLLDRGLRTYV